MSWTRLPIVRKLVASRLRTANLSLVGLTLLLLTTGALPARALSPALTPEKVQRKAVVVGHDAKLYKQASGDSGVAANFMQIFFILAGGSGDRIPVTDGPSEEAPDGWLDKDAFVEWNTLQMINFEPQSGRELSKIFKDSACAEQFGRDGVAGACKELGSEPRRTEQRDSYRLLIPVFERSRETYKGGFVRVTANGPVVEPQPDQMPRGNPEPSARAGRSFGYDLVLVVDATLSMQDWFKPTTRALQRFVQWAKQQSSGGELNKSFRTGLLFYRDRKLANDCNIGFLTRWEMPLTDDINAITNKLLSAEETKCESDEVAEAVYDGLNRALLDPAWGDSHFKVVLLVGDAPPHPSSNVDKNPLGLDVGKITEMSAQRSVRFLTFKINDKDTLEFRALAESVEEEHKGRFRVIKDHSGFEEAFFIAMQEEWGLLTTTDTVEKAGIGAEELKKSRALQQRYNIDDYELPIILAHLPPADAGERPPEFVEGWVSQKIKQRLAVGEYIFMRQTDIKIVANIIDTIATAAEQGAREGSEVFLSTLRYSLATMLKMQPDQLFRSGESLASMMAKANVLPFKTTVLSFTAEEVNQWKPSEFERLNKLMREKIEVLREYIQMPGNIRYFGDTAHVYVPRNLFP